MTIIDLERYDNSWYHPGRSLLWRAAWMFLGLPLFRSTWFASSALRAALLRAFGAHIGKDVVIRQHVNIKYPWHLTVGDHCWIGEQVWIDNLTTVKIGSNVCLSQAAYLCTGNHDWSDPAFGLIVKPIEIADGAWAGARSILMPGVRLGRGSIAAAGSVVTSAVPDFHIVSGNPAALVKKRVIADLPKSNPAHFPSTLREMPGRQR